MSKNDIVFRSRFQKFTKKKTECSGESRTKQEFKNDVDINQIMARVKRGAPGNIGLNSKQPVYGDFSDAMTYHESLNLVVHTQQMFEQLPAPVRKMFGNDPEAFLEYAGNPENAEHMAQLGLMKPEAVKRVKSEKQRVEKKQQVSGDDGTPENEDKDSAEGTPSAERQPKRKAKGGSPDQ